MEHVLNLEKTVTLRDKRKLLAAEIETALDQRALLAKRQAADTASVAAKAIWDSIITAAAEGRDEDAQAQRKKLGPAEIAATEAARTLVLEEQIAERRSARVRPLRQEVQQLDLEIALAAASALSERFMTDLEAYETAVAAAKAAAGRLKGDARAAASLSRQGMSLANWSRDHVSLDSNFIDGAVAAQHEQQIMAELSAAGIEKFAADDLHYQEFRKAFESALPQAPVFQDPHAEFNRQVAVARAASKTDVSIEHEDHCPAKVRMRDRDPYEPSADVAFRSWEQPDFQPGRTVVEH